MSGNLLLLTMKPLLYHRSRGAVPRLASRTQPKHHQPCITSSTRSKSTTNASSSSCANDHANSNARRSESDTRVSGTGGVESSSASSSASDAAAAAAEAASAPSSARIRILAINDVYELENLPRLATLRRRLRPPPDAVVLAGDFLSPSMLSSIDQGRGMVDMLNRVSDSFK
jgi:2',3'-cyclic-nucleotide 2'-phosphodiesterase (5'-nucleotidase family)